MPKLIDHSQRREEISEATWRVIRQQGITAVSIRTVAAEAHLSTGSLRHVFPRKSDLLAHAMQLTVERVHRRIAVHLSEPDPRTLVLRVIRELLPLDAERRLEMEVNIALVAEAPGDPSLRQARDDAYRAQRQGCERFIHRLTDAGLTRANLDPATAAAALHGLIDGLAMHLLITADPDMERQALAAVEAMLDSLR